MVSRAVSAKSDGFVSAKRRTVRIRNVNTQTESTIEAEDQTPEELFAPADDVPDGSLRQSFSDFGVTSYAGKLYRMLRQQCYGQLNTGQQLYILSQTSSFQIELFWSDFLAILQK